MAFIMLNSVLGNSNSKFFDYGGGSLDLNLSKP